MTFFKPKENGHKHVFLVKLANAVGFWQKRECPGDGQYFRGIVRECECGAKRFRPYGLREVEVTHG